MRNLHTYMYEFYNNIINNPHNFHLSYTFFVSIHSIRAFNLDSHPNHPIFLRLLLMELLHENVP